MSTTTVSAASSSVMRLLQLQEIQTESAAKTDSVDYSVSEQRPPRVARGIRVMTHRWHWRKWLPNRHGQLCRVLATGRKNSALVEFEDGHKVITSRYAVRKVPNAALAERGDGK